MVTAHTKEAPLATQDDVVQAGKAIHDRLSKMFGDRLAQLEKSFEAARRDDALRMKALLDQQEKSAESEDRVTPLLKAADAVFGRVDMATKHYDALFREHGTRLDKSLVEQNTSVGMMGESLRKELAETTKSLLESYKSLDEAHKAINLLRNELAELRGAVGAIKPIQFVLPEGAIQINQSTPVLHLTLPENSIRVEQSTPILNLSVPENAFHLEAAPVTVNVPEQRSIVNVQVPEQAPPNVNVSVPRRKTKKTISYCEITGRPNEIIEIEEGE